MSLVGSGALLVEDDDGVAAIGLGAMIADGAGTRTVQIPRDCVVVGFVFWPTDGGQALGGTLNDDDLHEGDTYTIQDLSVT